MYTDSSHAFTQPLPETDDSMQMNAECFPVWTTDSQALHTMLYRLLNQRTLFKQKNVKPILVH